MNRKDAERIITEYMKPIFGFAVKHCKTAQDAEDLSQEIILKAYRSLLVKDDIRDPRRFIWTIAHNALNNYYRSTDPQTFGLPLDEFADKLADPSDSFGESEDFDTIRRLQSEIAYLSKLQRQIILAYYFEQKKQSDIANELNIPLGTVKWHLFEAKKELKRGIAMTRKNSDLRFNPIQFHSYGINGSSGRKSLDEFFRSTLSQNICYSIRNQAKTVSEIADDLGVSPVYVESEVDFLEEYGFLQKNAGKYLANFIISEPTESLLNMQDEMCKQAAALFADELFDALVENPLLEKIRSGEKSVEQDTNFLLWSLIPYVAACSGDDTLERKISFEEVATIRPDGGHNIFQAFVMNNNIDLSENYVHMENWCGPMWQDDGKSLFWQVDSQWSDRRETDRFRYAENIKRLLSLFECEKDGPLSKEDYSWLSEHGYVRLQRNAKVSFHLSGSSSF